MHRLVRSRGGIQIQVVQTGQIGRFSVNALLLQVNFGFPLNTCYMQLPIIIHGLNP
jgi:hypothetical protein